MAGVCFQPCSSGSISAKRGGEHSKVTSLQITSLELASSQGGGRFPNSIEINEMFAKRVPARKWSRYRCDIAEYSADHSTFSGDQGDDLEKKVVVGGVVADEKVEKV